MYFLIYCDEDGDMKVRAYNKDDLLKSIKDEDYGPTGFFDKIPMHTDPQAWGNNILIIKGEIVCPKSVDVVKEYDIE